MLYQSGDPPAVSIGMGSEGVADTLAAESPTKEVPTMTYVKALLVAGLLLSQTTQPCVASEAQEQLDQ